MASAPPQVNLLSPVQGALHEVELVSPFMFPPQRQVSPLVTAA